MEMTLRTSAIRIHLEKVRTLILLENMVYLPILKIKMRPGGLFEDISRRNINRKICQKLCLVEKTVLKKK